jgi:hypothetical protein
MTAAARTAPSRKCTRSVSTMGATPAIEPAATSVSERSGFSATMR